MRARSRHTARRGMTVLEVMLAIALLAVVTTKIVGVLNTATENNKLDTARLELETKANHVLRQLGFAIMGSHPDSLVPNVGNGLSSTSVRYQISLGITDGKPVWSAPEEIALLEPTREVFWTDTPEAAEQRRVVWSRLVAPYLEGELPNGVDDNGNGLIDEKGLAISIAGKTVEMHLTLERVMDDGTVLTETVSTKVACRNLVDGWREAQ